MTAARFTRKFLSKTVLVPGLFVALAATARPAQAQVGVVTVQSPGYGVYRGYGYRPFRPNRPVYTTGYGGWYGGPRYYRPRVYAAPTPYVVPPPAVYVNPAPRVYGTTVYYPPML